MHPCDGRGAPSFPSPSRPSDAAGPPVSSSPLVAPSSLCLSLGCCAEARCSSPDVVGPRSNFETKGHQNRCRRKAFAYSRPSGWRDRCSTYCVFFNVLGFSLFFWEVWKVRQVTGKQYERDTGRGSTGHGFVSQGVRTPATLQPTFSC